MMKIYVVVALTLTLSACSYESKEPLVIEMKARGGPFIPVAAQWESAEQMMAKGMEMLNEGRDQVSEGRQLVQTGEVNQREGNNMYRQGERIRYEAEMQYRQINAIGGPPIRY